jgi:PilZ domain
MPVDPVGWKMAEEGMAIARGAQAERRVHERHGVNSRATVILVRSGARVEGNIVDLSLGGCRVETDESFPLGIYTRVETEFRLEGITFRLGGVVQAVHGPRQVGIRFLEVTERKRGQLVELMEELDAMRKEAALAPPPQKASA